MIEDAKAEGNRAAERNFTYANEVEKVHAALYQKASDNLEALEEKDYYVCSVCGYTCENGNFSISWGNSSWIPAYAGMTK